MIPVIRPQSIYIAWNANEHRESPIQVRCRDRGLKRSLPFHPVFAKAVSYTHLDVYKRQDIDAVSADLRRNTYLVDQVTDIIHRVVRGGIQFVDVERTVFVESFAGFALVACFGIGCRVQTVDRFGEDTGASGFTHATWAAKQIRMGQLTATDSIFQCRGNM